MAVTKIRSKWVSGLLEFFGITTGETVLKITESGIEANLKGNVTGALSGGEVNPTIAVIAGEDISKGDLVYPSGYDATSGKIKVKKADADGDNPAKAAWFVAPADIQNAAAGTVVGVYELTGQNTNAGNVGDPVYLSDATAGGWSLSAPSTAGDCVQQVGVVTAKSDTAGKVLLMPFYSKNITVPAS